MAYPIEDKFVIAVASSALFDLKESDQVFQEQGEEIGQHQKAVWNINASYCYACACLQYHQ